MKLFSGLPYGKYGSAYVKGTTEYVVGRFVTLVLTAVQARGLEGRLQSKFVPPPLGTAYTLIKSFVSPGLCDRGCLEIFVLFYRPRGFCYIFVSNVRPTL